MVGSPSGPEPRRFAGCLVRNCRKHRERRTDIQSPGQGGPENDREKGRQGRRNRETSIEIQKEKNGGGAGRGEMGQRWGEGVERRKGERKRKRGNK